MYQNHPSMVCIIDTRVMSSLVLALAILGEWPCHAINCREMRFRRLQRFIDKSMRSSMLSIRSMWPLKAWPMPTKGSWTKLRPEQGISKAELQDKLWKEITAARVNSFGLWQRKMDSEGSSWNMDSESKTECLHGRAGPSLGWSKL